MEDLKGLPAHEEVLGEELLHLPRAINQRLVFFRQFIHPENGNDVAELLVPLQHLHHTLGNVVVFLAHHERENTA